VPVADQNKTGAPRGTAERLRLVAACPDLSPPQKAVLSLVALQHNEKKGYAWVDDVYAWQMPPVRNLNYIFHFLAILRVLALGGQENGQIH